MEKAISVFYCCTGRDARLVEELDRHLALLVRRGIISTWRSNLQLSAGHTWDSELEKPFESARILLFLVSADFLAHVHIWDRQIMRAMEKHVKGEVRVIPILLSPCLLEGAPFAGLKALPDNGEFLSMFERSKRDREWTKIATALQHVAQEMQESI